MVYIEQKALSLSDYNAKLIYVSYETFRQCNIIISLEDRGRGL